MAGEGCGADGQRFEGPGVLPAGGVVGVWFLWLAAAGDAGPVAFVGGADGPGVTEVKFAPVVAIGPGRGACRRAMLSLPPSVRIFLCLVPADMRRSFEGLMLMAEKIVFQDPFSGHLFVFVNQRKDRVKVLSWDGGGFAIWYKRLEEGSFRFAETGSGAVEIAA